MRAFLAIELSPECRAWIARGLDALRERNPAVRWVDPANLHVTLHFFGEIPDSEAPGIAAALGRATEGHAPFPMALGRPGSFGGRVPRVVLRLRRAFGAGRLDPA